VQDAHAGIELRLGRAHVTDQGNFVDERLVDIDVEQDGGTATVLREDDGTLGLLHLLDTEVRTFCRIGTRCETR